MLSMVEFKVVTTTHFADMDSVEEFLQNNGAFEAYQVNELLDDKTLTIEVEDPNESVIGETTNVFTLKEVKND